MTVRLNGRSQSGNVFFAIFGAVALVGVLTAGVSTFVKGPLATSVKITRMNTAENQMSIAGQVAVMAAANAPGGGDCDSDTFVEPIEWREDLTKPFPVGGGLIPLTIGISKKDPWGTEYGYCVWDHGAATNGAGTCGGASQKRLAGHNSKIYPVVALVSAGPDKTFTTTCRSFDDADVNGDDNLETAGVDLPMVGKAASNDDDIIFTYTYDEATGASGGLWSLKSGNPDVAVISKGIETSGVGSFAGGVLLPDSSLITCDPTTAGIMAKNASGDGISICDGTGWQELSGGVSTPYGVGLVMDPNTSSGMNITAPCGGPTCYSTNVVFAVVNKLQPPASSDVLTVTLSNTANFEKVSDNCNGNSIPAGGNCQITVRAKAMGDVGYTGKLSIAGNNAPFANLDGVSTGFGCNIGGDAPGGKFAACNVGGYNLIVTPSGCTASPNNPTCAGTPDTYTANFTPGNVSAFSSCCSTSSGAQQTADFDAYTGGIYTFPAVNWCANLQYAGFDDWFLPSHSEMTNLYVNKAVLGSAASGDYWVSNGACDWPSSRFYNLSIVNGGNGGCSSSTAGNYNKYVRCMRWDPVKVTTPTPDTTPFSITFTPSTGPTAGEVRASNVADVYGITRPAAFLITGGTGAEYSKNGGAYSSSPTTVVSGDTISLRATSPVAGQEDIVAITVGTSSYSWRIRTVANNTIYAFVTSAVTQANMGIGGADGMCASAVSAAGLAGSWKAILSTSAGAGGGPVNRVPWNWSLLKNMNNEIIATSFADFTDGTWSAPINRTATNALSAQTYAWTGAVDNAGTSGYSNYDGNICDVWGTTGYSTRIANIQSGTQGFGGYSAACAASLPIICMQDPGGALIDTDPAEVIIRPGIAYTPGAAALSNAVSVTSILQPVTVTITPTSGGTANLIKNGVSQGAATTTANPNDTIQFSLTVPAVLGTKNTATIQIGDDPYTWWVGYADSAKEAKVFVTSIGYGANMGGVAGADNLCTLRAAASPYGLGSKWKAILSSSTVGAAERVAWNWGTLKTVTGATIVDGGYNDLFDGSTDAAISTTELGTNYTGFVWTGSNAYGVPYHANGVAARLFCNNWQGGMDGFVLGSSTNPSSTIYSSSEGSWGCTYNAYALYCLEDVDDSTDIIPASMNIPYKVQVATSSRQSSDAINIAGMSSGATTTLSVSATGGTPTFKVNGGAEVTSATVTNGDSVVFLMDAPGVDNSSNKMTIKANGGADTLGYWRVWTGDSTGSVVKRVFVTKQFGGQSGNYGGLAGVHNKCNTIATAAGLGGTWKAIASGQNEGEFAVNQIGYNWSTLRRIDGVNVVLAGNIWSTNTTPLLNPISVGEDGTTTVSVLYVKTGTDRYGKSNNTNANGQCINWSSSGSSGGAPYYLYNGTSGVTGYQWIENGTAGPAPSYGGDDCRYSQYLYCIEQ